MYDVLDDINRWLASGERVALATVTSTWGSSPRSVGSHMAVTRSGRISGSVSGGCIEGAVAEEALGVIDSGIPHALEYGVADEAAWTVGLACGGSISIWLEPLMPDVVYQAVRDALSERQECVLVTALEGGLSGRKAVYWGGVWVGDAELAAAVDSSTRLPAATGLACLPQGRAFVQHFPPPPRMLIVGAVHIAIPLVRLARTVGYEVTVIDARSAFATTERFPEADALLREWPDTALERLRPDSNTAVVVLTHDPKFDEPALAAVLRSDAGYIGAIGSRATAEERARRLEAAGFSARQVARIHSPVGIDLGGRSPEEIALSILAEAVGSRYQSAAPELEAEVPA